MKIRIGRTVHGLRYARTDIFRVVLYATTGYTVQILGVNRDWRIATDEERDPVRVNALLAALDYVPKEVSPC